MTVPAILPSPPPVELLALAIVMYLGGCVTPFYYALERLRGFGRKIANLLPYEPPPGEEAGQALQDAVEQGENSPGDSEGSE